MVDEETTTPQKPRLSLFRDTPASIKTLRRTYKDRRADLDATKLAAELSDESDRSCIILLATILDDALVYRIAQHLCFEPNDDEYEYVFRFEGPLGTFSARAEIACIFGFIEDETYQELEIIRELRNACAHSKQPAVFSDPVFLNVLKRFLEPLGLMRLVDTQKPTLIRAVVICGAMFILATLMRGSREAAKPVMFDFLDKIIAAQPSPDKPI